GDAIVTAAWKGRGRGQFVQCLPTAEADFRVQVVADIEVPIVLRKSQQVAGFRLPIEILASPQRLRNIGREDGPPRLLKLLQRSKEPRLVSSNRASHREPVVIAGQLGRRLTGYVRGIEGVIAEKQEAAAVESVSAAFGYNVDHAA